MEHFQLEEWQRVFVVESYNKGMRSWNLESQPAPWVYFGLKKIESGETLTEDSIRAINLAGGTDHPDPTITI